MQNNAGVAARRTEYLVKLAAAIDAARQLADLPPESDGWGGGFNLYDHHENFNYCNTSDLLSDLAFTIEQAVQHNVGDMDAK